jgi:hypothetical protein
VTLARESADLSRCPKAKARNEYSGIKVTNSGLGPALEVVVTGNVQYERREYRGNDFDIIEKKSFQMMNCMGAVIDAQSSDLLPTGAPPGWTFSSNGFGSNDVTITYRDVFGTFYQSVGMDLYTGYFSWQPASGLFSPERRDAALQDYLKRRKK